MNFVHKNGAAPTRGAFGDLVVGCLPQLRSQACGLTGQRDSADDLVQDTLVRAFAAEGQFAPGTNLRGWLYTILRNAHRSNFRRRRFDTDSIDNVDECRFSSPPQQLVHLELKEALGALETLPENRREALLMVCAAGMSYEEAASASGCAVGTAKSRVNRARHHIRQRLSASETPVASRPTPFLPAISRRVSRLVGMPLSAAA